MFWTKKTPLAIAACCFITVKVAAGHGFVSEPPARNMFCGAICKPDGHGCNGLEACTDAFANDWNGGYQFMSVLTHDVGRGGSMGAVTNLPANVCGFDSETWQGGMTPWDATGVNWPTTTVDPSDPLKIVWDISYGPHFSDTQEFVYYITKDDFVFDKDRPLSWDDFEDTPFCILEHDPNDIDANPLVVPRISDAEFDTWCMVPTSKSGRHILYAEWGRNPWTYERFHGCIDVLIEGGAGSDPAPVPVPAPQPEPTPAPSPQPAAPVLPDPAPSPSNPLGIPYPCCGWNGDCEQPDNTWCHQNCDQCTGPCNGVFYTAPGEGSSSCNGAPAGPSPAPPQAGCCTWGGWSTCPSWTQTSNDPCQQDPAGCAVCSGNWIRY